MKKLLLLTKTLLAAALLCVGQSAWGAITTPYSWTFTGNAADADITKNVDEKITENKTECNPATAPSDCVGLYFNDAWKRYKSSTGLRNVSKGDRMCVIPGLKKDDVVTINCDNTDYINTTKYPGIANASKKSISFAMEADGNFYFKIIKAGGKVDDVAVYPSIYSITVTRGTDTSEFDALKAYADALVAVSNDNSAANSTLSDAISTQAAVVASATNQVAVTTATSALLAAMNAYVAAANPLTDSQFDLTYLLTNPNLEGITDNGDAATQGWYTDIPRSDLGTYNNFQVRTSLLDGLNAVERFTSNACKTANTYALYQKVTLPVGNYSFSAKAMANQATSIVMAVGDTEGDAVTSAGAFADYGVDFSIDAAGEKKIGIKISSKGTNTCYWMALTRLKLYKEPASSVSATIGSTGWTTFASPYALDLSNMTASTGEVAAYYASATSAESVTVETTESSAVQAGEGIMLKGTAGATITIPVVASGSAISGNLLVGCPTSTTITNETANYENIYVLGAAVVEFQNIKNWIDTNTSLEIPAGKAYLNATASNGARSMRISFGDITGVENVEAASDAKAQEGKFVENGKLVIMKNGQKYNAAGAKLY